MQVEELRDLVVKTLEDMKAFDIVTLDVRGKT
ncbi:MAG TPA: ribosome silencing factor, partial [Gammaproteobacteria bacterium]|nr:ribosome silencing factor [Gammaproteobacteria bacterium]